MSVHRPYALRKNRGKYPPSVTTVLDAFSIGSGLQWWAATLTAEFAVDQPQAWRGLGRDEAVAKLRFVHDVARRAAAERGTIIHAVSEAWARDSEVDLDVLVRDAANRDKSPITAWQGREEHIATEIEGYVDALEQFWRDRRPEFVGIEEVVLHDDKSHGYIGQRDFTARLADMDGVSLVDIKTLDDTNAPTATEPFHGIHFEKYALQLAAYRGAEWLVAFDDDGNETTRTQAYPIARALILALRSDGTYQLVEVKAAGDELATFYRLVDVWRYRQDAPKKQFVADRTIYRVLEAVA